MLKSYRCAVCGYIHVGSHPPVNCPVCGAPAEEFEEYEDGKQQLKPANNSWRCLNCEYVHEGSSPPAVCPVCGAKSDTFEPYEKKHSDQPKDGMLKAIIIGGGIAALSCAEEIRNNSEKAEITMISKEKHFPYYRLNLTRFLAGETDKDSLTIYPESWYKEKRISLITGKEVHEIHKEQKSIQLEDGTSIPYDRLILANGAHPFIPPIQGSDLKNVVTVRTMEDSEFILEKMKSVKACICIGGGILGLEVAGAIAKSGVHVLLLEGSEWLMPRQLNRKAAARLKEYLKTIGVEVKENASTQEITGSEKCEGVRLSTGELLPAELVIITAGVRPNTNLARKSGLEVNSGMVVDNHMRTSEEDIYGAGDVTEHNGMLYGLWNAAQFQGKIAAQNVMGINSQFGGIPRSNVLKVLGLDMFSIGQFSPLDGSYYQYEKETPEYYYNFIVRDGRIVGSIVMGDKTLSIKVKQAVERGIDFPHELYNDVDGITDKLCEQG
ncbi:MAG: FAD-dependent oxidoreductase [Clostridiales bacterium]|nr:FAD-dependent oxidoreductase [Clostridiales bacterium]